MSISLHGCTTTQDRSSRAGRIGRLAHTASPPRIGPHRTENHGVDERSMRGVFSGSRAGTKLRVCHRSTIIFKHLGMHALLSRL
jgi:hypothetical protein